MEALAENWNTRPLPPITVTNEMVEAAMDCHDHFFVAGKELIRDMLTDVLNVMKTKEKES